jgi:hypothetical protein
MVARRNVARLESRKKRNCDSAAHYDVKRLRLKRPSFTVVTMNSSSGSCSDSSERRDRSERRRRRLWSVWYGSFKPRRRSHPRRADDLRFHSRDWYSARLLAVSIGISLLSMADAFLTLTLLNTGADEINPLMAALLDRGTMAFTVFKMATTSVCVLALVVLSNYRFMRLIRVENVMYLVLASYISLIAYELWLLQEPLEVIVL